MAKENNIREGLLTLMDTDSDGPVNANTDSTQKVIELHRAQVIRLKWIAAISWLATVLYSLGMYILKDFLLVNYVEGALTRNEVMLIRYSDMGLKVLIVISVLLTYLSYCRSRTLTMLQISARLAGIEEHLKKMSLDR